jgi:hypothetical protein
LSENISRRTAIFEAPRPIRPHPSQGPFIPLSEQLDRVVINPSRGAPIEGWSFIFYPILHLLNIRSLFPVPSAAYLEEKIERQKMPSVKSKPVPANYLCEQNT